MTTRVRLTIDIDVTSMGIARRLAEDTDALRALIMRNDNVEGVDITADIDFAYGPQHEHLKENADVEP